MLFLERQRAILLDKKTRYEQLDPTKRDPLWVAQKQAVALPNIEEALRAIDNGTYGTCQGCENKIPQSRLETVPGATRCIDCQKEVHAR